MDKARKTIYTTYDDIEWLEYFGPGNTLSASMSFIFSWATTGLKVSAVHMLDKFESKERFCLLLCFQEFTYTAHTVTPGIMSLHYRDWAEAGFGYIREQITPDINHADIAQKIASLTQFEALALLCWVRGYERIRDDTSFSIDTYQAYAEFKPILP